MKKDIEELEGGNDRKKCCNRPRGMESWMYDRMVLEAANTQKINNKKNNRCHCPKLNQRVVIL